MELPSGVAVAVPDLGVRRRPALRRPTSRPPIVLDLASDAEGPPRPTSVRSRGAAVALALAFSLGLHALAALALEDWLAKVLRPEPATEAIRVVLLAPAAVAPTATPRASAVPEPAAQLPPMPAEHAREKRRARVRPPAAPHAPVAAEAAPAAEPAATSAPAPVETGAPASSASSATASLVPLASLRLARQVAPVYPRAAREAGAAGTSLLRVHVTPSGGVDGIRIERSAGHAALDRAAESAVRQWRFAAPVPSEDPAGVWVLAPIEFRLR